MPARPCPGESRHRGRPRAAGRPTNAQVPDELSVINEMTKEVASTLNLGEIVRTALAHIKSVASAEAISLLRYDAERDELVFAATEMMREAAFAGHQEGSGQ